MVQASLFQTVLIQTLVTVDMWYWFLCFLLIWTIYYISQSVTFYGGKVLVTSTEEPHAAPCSNQLSTFQWSTMTSLNVLLEKMQQMIDIHLQIQHFHYGTPPNCSKSTSLMGLGHWISKKKNLYKYQLRLVELTIQCSFKGVHEH